MLIFADRLLLKLQWTPSMDTRGTVSELIFAPNKPEGTVAELAVPWSGPDSGGHEGIQLHAIATASEGWGAATDREGRFHPAAV